MAEKLSLEKAREKDSCERGRNSSLSISVVSYRPIHVCSTRNVKTDDGVREEGGVDEEK